MWSIGIHAGESVFNLKDAPGVSNPILTRKSVSDVRAGFVADPFMVNHDGRWHMFFEVLNQETQTGQIGLATSADGLRWSYQQIVLAEAFHLSYPCVFEWKNEFYMVPETLQPETVRIYKAHPFPTRWSFVGSLLERRCADPTVFRYQDRWWMFTCSAPYQHDVLRLFFADDLMGPWMQHPLSPILEGDKQNARPAGRVLVTGKGVFRFAQDCVTRYGSQIRAFEILELTPTRYAEKPHPGNPILQASGRGWNALGMHHIDAHLLPDGGWLACVDGLSAAD